MAHRPDFGTAEERVADAQLGESREYSVSVGRGLVQALGRDLSCRAYEVADIECNITRNLRCGCFLLSLVCFFLQGPGPMVGIVSYVEKTPVDSTPVLSPSFPPLLFALPSRPVLDPVPRIGSEDVRWNHRAGGSL